MTEGKVCVSEPFSNGEIAQWIRRFEICSDANKWDDATKLVRPPTLLQRQALSVFERLDLSEDDRKSNSAVKAALLNVFEPNTETSCPSSAAAAPIGQKRGCRHVRLPVGAST